MKMRSPITGLVNQFHELTVEEQKVFLDLVDPQPEQEVQKQTRKKRGKSQRASGMAAAIKKSLELKAQAHSNALCAALVPGLDVVCGNPEDNRIHDPKGGYGGYHPFVSVAQPVAKKSSRKSAGTSSIQSTEAATENALSASSGGD